MTKCCRSWCDNEAYVLSRFVDADGERDGWCKECWYDTYGIKVFKEHKCAECGKEITGDEYAHNINYTKRYCSERCLANAIGYRLVEDFNDNGRP